MAAVVGVWEIALTAMPDGARVIMNIHDLLDMYQRNPFMAMRFMGLVNMIMITLNMVFYAAACSTGRDNTPSLSLLAFAIFLVSTAVFFSCNSALPLLEVSRKYIAAGTPEEKAALLAAAEALFAHGASHTPGTFPGFLFGQAAGIMLSVTMMRSSVFKLSTGIIGIIAFVFLLAFEVVSSFISAWFNQVMVLAVIGGISAITWYIKSGLELIKSRG
jgi:hypothetical protein